MAICAHCGAGLPPGTNVCPGCKKPVSTVDDNDDTGSTLYGVRPDTVLGGRFRLMRRIGSGGMGDVWLAEDTELHEQAAIKILRDTLVGDSEALGDLKKEVAVTRKLRHPNIVAVFDLHIESGLYFIVMEYVEGCTLAHALAKRGIPFELAEILPWARQMATALDYAHQQGVLHRDVKPANMLLTHDGTAKLADFGIARIAEDTETKVTGREASGTLPYMSPEQLMGEPCDNRSDLYSLAASLYELLSGKPPFHTGSIATQIQFKPPQQIDGLSGSANEMLLHGLAKAKEDRQTTCLELVEQLHDWLDQQAFLPVPDKERKNPFARVDGCKKLEQKMRLTELFERLEHCRRAEIRQVLDALEDALADEERRQNAY